MKRKKSPDTVKAFDDALGSAPAAERYKLRLFVAGTTPRSVNAIRNLKAICDERLKGRYELSVIDLYQHPEQARPDQIVVAPTLVKSLPLPVRRIIGDLSNTERVLVALDLVPQDDPHGG